MAVPVAAAASFPRALRAAQTRARAAGSLVSFDSDMVSLADGCVARVATNLRQKKASAPPAQTAEGEAKAAERVEPFLPPFEDGLLVLDEEWEWRQRRVLLNKFNVMTDHVLVVPRKFISQNAPLDVEDWAAAWSLLRAYEDHGAREWPSRHALAFYNRGPASGFSQRMRHVQVLPAVEGECELPLLHWERRARRITCFNFRHVAVPVPRAPVDGAALEALLEEALGELNVDDGDPDASFNWLLTRDVLLVVPRRVECPPDRPGLSLNALAFAGSFFVKSAEDLRYVRATGPLALLEQVAFPP